MAGERERKHAALSLSRRHDDKNKGACKRQQSCLLDSSTSYLRSTASRALRIDVRAGARAWWWRMVLELGKARSRAAGVDKESERRRIGRDARAKLSSARKERSYQQVGVFGRVRVFDGHGACFFSGQPLGFVLRWSSRPPDRRSAMRWVLTKQPTNHSAVHQCPKQPTTGGVNPPAGGLF